MSYIYTTTQLNFNCYTNAIRIANLKLHAVPLAAAKGVSECVRSRLMHAYTYHIPYPHRDFPIVSVCTSVFMCIHVYSCVCLCLSSCGVVWCGVVRHPLPIIAPPPLHPSPFRSIYSWWTWMWGSVRAPCCWCRTSCGTPRKTSSCRYGADARASTSG